MGIEIVGFPQKLYTGTFGDPDTLFVPLLEAARDANKMLARACWLGGGAWNRRDAERHAIGVFAAPRQDGKRREAAGKLAPEIEENLKRIISFVQGLFVKK